LLPGATFISKVNGVANFTAPDIADVFTCIAALGETGCGFEQHLESMKRALDGTQPANANFLREDAYLAVIFIADEDDCSIAKVGLLSAADTSLGPLQSFRCTRFGITCDIGGQTPDQMNQVGTKDQCHSNEASQFLAKTQTFVDFVTPNNQVGIWFELTSSPAATRPWAGFSTNDMQSGDMHALIVFASAPNDDFRVTGKYVGPVTNQTIALGPAMNATTATQVAAGAYPRFRFQGTLPPEYNKLAAIDVTPTTSGNTYSIVATGAYLTAAGSALSYSFTMRTPWLPCCLAAGGGQ